MNLSTSDYKRVTRSLVLYVCFVDRCLFFCIFLLAIALSVLLRYTNLDYPFGIFKFFLHGLWPVELKIIISLLIIFTEGCFIIKSNKISDML